MEMPDISGQTRIWQRVRGEQVPVTDGLPAMVTAALTEAAIYGVLTRRTQGPARELLQQLREQEWANARCMKGIYVLVTGTPLAVTAPTPEVEQTEIALRKCYGSSLRALAAYEGKMGREEYGPVFEMLAAREREHCRKITEIAGLLCV